MKHLNKLFFKKHKTKYNFFFYFKISEKMVLINSTIIWKLLEYVV